MAQGPTGGPDVQDLPTRTAGESLDETEPTHSSRGRGVLWAGLALVTLQALLRGWVGMRGYLSQDDFAFEYRASTMPLFSSHYLFDAWNGHLMPGSFVLVWVATHVAPLEIWPGVLMDLVLQAATGLVLLALLRELFGARKAVLVPLALFLFTPATLTGFAWWAAALNQVPAMLGMVGSLYLHVRYLRSGRTRTGLYAVLVFLLGLAFFEKVLLLAPLVFLFTAMYAVPGSWRKRLLGTVELHWRVWAVWLVVLLPYTIYYRNSVDSTVNGTTTPTAFLDLLGTSWHAWRPTVLGGPWRWASLGGPTNAIPAVGGLLSAVSWIVVVVVVAGGAAFYRQSARAWVLPAWYFVTTAALLATGRNQIGPIIGVAYRYYSEAALLTALALCLAWLPLVGTVAKGALTVLERRSWVDTLLGHARTRSATGGAVGSLSPHSRLVVVRGVVIALVLSCTLSTVRYDASWHANTGGAYVATVRSAFARAPNDLVLADTPAPPSVLSLWPPYNSVSHILAPLPHLPRFLRLGETSESLSMLDDNGHVHPAFVNGVHNAKGPVASCGWLASGSSGAVIPIRPAPFSWVWTVRIGYIASEETRATVRAGRQSVHVQLRSGLHALYLLVDGEVPDVTIEGLAAGASVCTDDVRVGPIVALPG